MQRKDSRKGFERPKSLWAVASYDLRTPPDQRDGKVRQVASQQYDFVQISFHAPPGSP
jgi:hypothetical protein